jgi:hypothetical protein
MSVSARLRTWWCRKVATPQPEPLQGAWEPRSLELEWAQRLLADAEQQERQERCAARGHSQRHEVANPANPQREYLCSSCGALILEDW